MEKIKIVIMAGGVGERFWPKSRKKLPKQFLNLAGKNSMIQDTVNRLLPIVAMEDIYIATGEIYIDLVREHLPQLPISNIITEPCGKNTAACIGLVAKHIEKENPNAIMVVLPADHVIQNEEVFRKTIIEGVEIASENNNIITIGIVPLSPEVGYGYIKASNEINLKNAKKVDRFVEKPNKGKAEMYIKDGNYLWNSGMFIWSVKTFLGNMTKHMPKHNEILSKISAYIGSEEYESVLKENYQLLDSTSVDYGILEHAENIYVLPSEFGWDDVGSWNSIERLNEKDEFGNVQKGEILTLLSQNCTIEANDKLIVAIGLDNLVIVDTNDALLICNKDYTNNIKDVITELKKQNDTRL